MAHALGWRVKGGTLAEVLIIFKRGCISMQIGDNGICYNLLVTRGVSNILAVIKRWKELESSVLLN